MNAFIERSWDPVGVYIQVFEFGKRDAIDTDTVQVSLLSRDKLKIKTRNADIWLPIGKYFLTTYFKYSLRCSIIDVLWFLLLNRRVEWSSVRCCPIDKLEDKQRECNRIFIEIS